ncbi:MAG: FliM/FliN family flagellar motor switch protein [Candidatus Acidiferrales bacterium]
MAPSSTSVAEPSAQAAPLAQAPTTSDPWAGFLHVSTIVAVDATIVGLTVRELFRLERGSIVATAQPVESNVPLRAGGSLIGWGEFQVVGEKLAVRVAELA